MKWIHALLDKALIIVALSADWYSAKRSTAAVAADPGDGSPLGDTWRGSAPSTIASSQLAYCLTA